VWSQIATNLSALYSTWWEFPEITKKLNAFRRVCLSLCVCILSDDWQHLFYPLVEKLGYDYSPTEMPDTLQLRTLAIREAADAGHERCFHFRYVIKAC
jgi:aminopeptidase 2